MLAIPGWFGGSRQNGDGGRRRTCSPIRSTARSSLARPSRRTPAAPGRCLRSQQKRSETLIEKTAASSSKQQAASSKQASSKQQAVSSMQQNSSSMQQATASTRRRPKELMLRGLRRSARNKTKLLCWGVGRGAIVVVRPPLGSHVLHRASVNDGFKPYVSAQCGSNKHSCSARTGEVVDQKPLRRCRRVAVRSPRSGYIGSQSQVIWIWGRQERRRGKRRRDGRGEERTQRREEKGDRRRVKMRAVRREKREESREQRGE